jgi:hypothetical protein
MLKIPWKPLTLMLVASMMIGAFAASAIAADGYDYDFSHYDYGDNLDTRPHASTAANYQEMAGYTKHPLTDATPHDAWLNLGDSELFFFIGHTNSGKLGFGNGQLLIEKDLDGFDSFESASSLDQLKLAVYCGCLTGTGSTTWGNLMDGDDLGITTCLGWYVEIEAGHVGYWVDRFWDDMRQGDTVANAGSDATSYVYSQYWWNPLNRYGGTNCWTTSGDAYLTIT